MNFCSNCGTKLTDGIDVCPNCGFVAQAAAPKAEPQPVYAPQPAPQQAYAPQPAPAKESGLATVAKVFMIIGTVAMGLYLIPLAWCLPMTISYCNKIKNNEPISMGFKICSLLFVNTIAGILMLCDKEH